MNSAKHRSKFYDFFFSQSAKHRKEENRLRRRNSRYSRPRFGLYLEALDLAKGVIITVSERFSGRPGKSDASISLRLLQSASFMQGMELCEQSISEALYAQAAALVRQELELIAAIEETTLGHRVEKATPNVARAPWKLKRAYDQLSMMSHSSSTAMLRTLHRVTSAEYVNDFETLPVRI
jgi:hypothetical protein